MVHLNDWYGGTDLGVDLKNLFSANLCACVDLRNARIRRTRAMLPGSKDCNATGRQ